jgi:TRAP-type C4-dicarboxylate transport system permease small subunit
MKPDKAPGYWPTRILLAIAIIATAIALAFALWSAFWAPPTFGDDNPPVLGLPSTVGLSLLAVGLALLGLVWAIRIFRGPRDEPPPWRYRDR